VCGDSEKDEKSWFLRNLADASYGMLRVCTIFQKTIRVLLLMVLVLVFSLLISLAPMEHSTLKQIEFGTTIQTPFDQRETIHMGPPKAHDSKDSFFLSLHFCDKGLKCFEMAGLHSCQPRITLFSRTLAH